VATLQSFALVRAGSVPRLPPCHGDWPLSSEFFGVPRSPQKTCAMPIWSERRGTQWALRGSHVRRSERDGGRVVLRFHAPARASRATPPDEVAHQVSISPPIRLDVRTPALRVLFSGPHGGRKHCDKRRHRRPRSQSAFRRRRCSNGPARPSAYRAVVQLLLGRRRLAGGARSARAQRVLSGRGQPSARPHRAKEAR
jgi:hypothetical protein